MPKFIKDVVEDLIKETWPYIELKVDKKFKIHYQN